MSSQSTQFDRIIAVVLAFLYMFGLGYFLVNDATDREMGYYVTAGALIVLPTVIFLLSRVLAFQGISDKLEALHQSTTKIESQTNGAFSDRLDKQTDAIVSRVIDELKQ